LVHRFQVSVYGSLTLGHLSSRLSRGSERKSETV
jgi:hypothetical protein